jgi:GTP cyclohydrolase II
LVNLKKTAEVRFPSIWATFDLLGFEGHAQDGAGGNAPETGLALILGDVHSSPPIVRIHSQCTTGEVFHSLRCDCHDQLHVALRAIAQEGAGVLVYEQQEGRGIGLMEKLRAYELQDEGLDTIEANLRLGHPVDARDYQMPVAILRFLGIEAVRLMTNNPRKIDAVRSAGIRIHERLAAGVPATSHSARYLATKREQLGHLSGFAQEFSAYSGVNASGMSPVSGCAHQPTLSPERR